MMTIETAHAGVHVNRGCVVAALTEIVTAAVHGAIDAGSSGDSLHPSVMTVLREMPNRSPPAGTLDTSLMHTSNSGTVLDRNQAGALVDRTQP